MASEYTIYCYFNSEQIKGVLNAVVMLMGSGGVDGDYLSLIRVAASIGIMLAAIYGFLRARGEEAAHYLIMVAMFYTTLFVPRVSVTIEDHGGSGAGAPQVVDNVPLGLAFFTSMTSHIGYWLTEKTETFFALPDSQLKLGRHGLMSGARTLRLAQSASLPDPVLSQDITNFMRDCINPELLISPAMVQMLFDSTDIWKALGHTGGMNILNPGRMVTLSGLGAEQCNLAWDALNPLITTAVNSETGRIARLLSPNESAAQAKTMLTSMLPVAEGLIMTASASAGEGIKQRMMLNVLNDTSSNMAQILNDPSAAQTAIGTSIATSNANSAYIVMAKIAQETMPLIRNAIELIVVGIFPIVLILIIIAGSKGGMVLRSYVMTMLWVQLWAPLYAIVNYVGTMASAKSMKAALNGVDGLAVNNAAALLNSSISAEAIAGLLTVSVPMIAMAIIKSGEAGLAGITQSGTSDRVAANVGSSVGSGNVSAANTQWGNASMNNTSANSHNSSYRYTASSRGDVKTEDGSFTMRGNQAKTDGAIGNMTSELGNMGVTGSHGSKAEASSGKASGNRAEATTGSSTSLSQGTAAQFTQQEGASAARKIQKALENVDGGDTSWSNRNGAGNIRSATNKSGTDERIAHGSEIGLGGSAGVRAGTEQSATAPSAPMQPARQGNQSGVQPAQQQGGSTGQQPPAQRNQPVGQPVQANTPSGHVQPGNTSSQPIQSGVQPAQQQGGSTGQQPPAQRNRPVGQPVQANTPSGHVQPGNTSSQPIQNAVPQGQQQGGAQPDSQIANLAERTARNLDKLPSRGSYGPSASYGMSVRDSESKTQSGVVSDSAERQKRVEQNYDKTEKAVEGLIAKTSNAGERAAMRSFLGSLAKSTNAMYSTSVGQTYTQQASNTLQRTDGSTAAVQVNDNERYGQEFLRQANGNVFRALRMARDPAVQEVVRANVAAQVAEQHGQGVGMDGKPIEKPTTVGEQRIRGVAAVQNQRPIDVATANAAGQSYLQQAVDSRQALGAPTNTDDPDLSPAIHRQAEVSAKAEQGYASAADAQAFEGGLNRLTNSVFKDKAGMGRLLDATFGFGLFGRAKTPDELRQPFSELAMNDPASRARIEAIGKTGNVSAEDINFLAERGGLYEATKRERTEVQVY